MEGYADVHTRLGATHCWRSVADQARFVLEPVLARTQGAEHRAAATLLARLRAYAGQ
jgi:hypothetical protein